MQEGRGQEGEIEKKKKSRDSWNRDFILQDCKKRDVSLLGSREGSAAEMPVQSISKLLSPALSAAQRSRAGAGHLSMHLSLRGPFPPFLGSTHGQQPSLILPWAGLGTTGRAKGRLCSPSPPAPLLGRHSQPYNGVLCRRHGVLLYRWGAERVIILFFVQWEPAIWNKLL